jgi:predicted transcriptional regulator
MTSEPTVADTTVADIMSRRIVAIRSDCDLHVAVQTFLRTALRHLVVVDRERAVLGILTVEQTMTALAASLTPVRLVGDHVPAPGARVRGSDSVRDAASVMLSSLVDALPVVDDDGRVVGVVTWSDILTSVAGVHLAT